MKRKGLAILGSTGSIGQKALELVRAHPERFRVISLSAGQNARLLEDQIREFSPLFASVATESALAGLDVGVPVGAGVEAAMEAASYEGVDIVLSAMSGAAGLLPTLSAIRAGKTIALANKETLVMAGSIVMDEARKRGVGILPVDSEHSAIFQSLVGHRADEVRRIILTASGGPFLRAPLHALGSATPEEALRHPNWDMGAKVSIDSATLVNKGLEVMEAGWLFGMGADVIEVSIHPQSVVHSMVEYIDGSVVAQLSTPDMKGPIAYALSYPERIGAVARTLDFSRMSLEFIEPERERFPCLGLCYSAMRSGGTMPAVLNAADEVAVAAFLDRRIPFTGIYRTIASVMERHTRVEADSIEVVLDADGWARQEAEAVINK